MQKKSFTVGYLPQNNSDVPYIRMRGKWLKNQLGFDIGDKLEVVKHENMLVLIKIPDKIVEQEKRSKKIKFLENQIRVLKVAEEKEACYF